MSSTSQVTDFSDLYTDLMNRVRVSTSDSATLTQAKRYINISLQDIFLGFGDKFSFAERSAVLRTRPSYTTGTIATTIGSTTVTGSSTLWNTNDDFSVTNARAGGKMSLNGNVYEVSSVTNDTTIVLKTAAIETLAAGTTYTYFEDEYTLASDYLKPMDFRTFSSPKDIPLISRTEFRRRFPRNNVVGTPVVATMVDVPTGSSAVINKRIRFFRPPSSTLLIPYSYVTANVAVSSSGTEATALSADTDQPTIPLIGRHVIVLGALAHWYRDKKDDQRSQEVQAEYEKALTRLIGDNDTGATPKPQIRPRLGSYYRKAKRPWNRGVGGKYVTGSRFDEMR
jgi:hypothetical protein